MTQFGIPVGAANFHDISEVRRRAERASLSRFSQLEWVVISLARNDALSSLESPRGLRAVLANLFGLSRQSTLADPRLEILRRVAVQTWHRGRQLPLCDVRRFLSAGFSVTQLRALLDSVCTQSTNRTHQNLRLRCQ